MPAGCFSEGLRLVIEDEQGDSVGDEASDEESDGERDFSDKEESEPEQPSSEEKNGLFGLLSAKRNRFCFCGDKKKKSEKDVDKRPPSCYNIRAVKLQPYDPLAQLAEHLTFNQGVWSSNLQWVTTKRSANAGRFFICRVLTEFVFVK